MSRWNNGRNAASRQADRGSNPDSDSTFEERKVQLTELELEGCIPRCILTRELRALTSGRLRYEKCPGRGFEKENVFFTALGGAGATSGPAGVDAGVGVEIGAGVSPSSSPASLGTSPRASST